MWTPQNKSHPRVAHPKNVEEVRSFHGLANFCRRFVPNFSSLASPLNDLVKKDVTFHWDEKQENSF